MHINEILVTCWYSSPGGGLCITVSFILKVFPWFSSIIMRICDFENKQLLGCLN